MNQKVKRIQILTELCSGCTRCMRVCPTEAIRIIDSKAELQIDKCIYCGLCFESCHVNAIHVSADSEDVLNPDDYHIAILPIAIYGMIKSANDLSVIYDTLQDLGFDEVVDLSPIYKILSEKIADYIENNDDYPYILTQCPSILRNIQLNYPFLVSNLLPFDFPYEIAARYVKNRAEKECQLDRTVKVSYITECLANLHAINEPIGKSLSSVDHVFLLSDIFKDILKHMNSTTIQETGVERDGIIWSKVGALRRTTSIRDYLSIDGITHVGSILEKADLKQLKHIKILECYSCVSGCVGGSFTLENRFIAKTKVNGLFEQLREEPEGETTRKIREYELLFHWEFEDEIKPYTKKALDDDYLASLIKLYKLNQLYELLPKIDCCACGAPTCRALAEDVVMGERELEDCVVLNKNEKK